MSNSNPDIITGEPGSHPVGTTVGATSAGIIGTVAGAGLAGPLGAVVGAAVGSALGGLVGHEAAEYVNPTYVAIEPQLQTDFAARPYAQGHTYEDYRSAYAFGAAERERFRGREWDDALEAELRSRWEASKANLDMAYLDARQAIRDSWHVAERIIPGDADRDGR